MHGIGYKFTGAVLALVMLAVAVVCPCAMGMCGGTKRGHVVMSCCAKHEEGQRSKDSGDRSCETFCSTRVLDHAKVASVDFSPLHFVGMMEMPAVAGVSVALPMQGHGWEAQVPREATRSLLRLHCALLV